MRHILITGAGGVIGSQIAKKLYNESIQLILLDKNKKRLEAACEAILEAENEAFPEPILVHQNLNKLDLIDQLGLTLYQNFGKLDGLITCHQILEDLGPISHYDRTHWDKMLQVNLAATFRILQSFDPLFQKSEAAHLIFLKTDELSSEDKPYWGVQKALQTAMEALINAYALEKAHQSIKAHLVDPGKVSSEFLYQAYPGAKEYDFQITDSFLSEIETIFSDMPAKMSA